MTTDPLGDMLTRIRNGYLARKVEVSVPYSKLKKALAEVLVKTGYLKNMKTSDDKVNKKILLSLVYQDNKPKLNGVTRISRPGVRIYVKNKNIPRIFGGMGMVILSTPEGIMNGRDAKKKGLGGELICKVW